MISFRTKNNSGQTLDMLQFASLLYLGMPLFLFFISWLKWYYALVMVTCLIVPLLSFNYNINLKGVKKFGLYFLVFCGFLLLLGYGEVFPQSGDWGKHNAIFSQLYHSWNQPVYIKYQGTNHILCYGLGFYMIPAWIAGLFKSYFMMRWLILVNSAIGLALIGVWMNRIWKLPIWAIVLVFLIGSIDWFSDIGWFVNNYKNAWDIFYTIGNIQFISILDQTPQHGISIVLVFLAIYYQFTQQSVNFLYCFIIVVFGFLWSPFLIFALLPAIFLININQLKRIDRASFFYGIPVIFVLFFICYYYKLHISADTPSFEILGFKNVVYLFVMRYSLLYGIKLFVIFFIHRKIKFLKPIEFRLILSFLLISIISKQINYGFFNDFEAKCTFLILFILNIYFIKAIMLYFSFSTLFFKMAFCLIVFALSFMPLKVIYMKMLAFRLVKVQKRFDCNVYQLSSDENIGLNEVLQKGTRVHHYPFIVQYLGEINFKGMEVMKANKR